MSGEIEALKERVHRLEEALRGLLDAKHRLTWLDAAEQARAALNSDTQAESRCSCCERPVAEAGELRGCRLMTSDPSAAFCRDCLYTWYDDGITDPAELKRAVLARCEGKP